MFLCTGLMARISTYGQIGRDRPIQGTGHDEEEYHCEMEGAVFTEEAWIYLKDLIESH